MSTLRLFVAVDPSAPIRARLGEAIARLRPRAPSAKWVDAGGLHVTLAFLGDVEEDCVPAITSAIAEVARARAPITLRFTGGGAFGGKRPRVLWAAIGGEIAALAEAQGALAAALVPQGYTPESRPFTAHLTLARAREPRGDAMLAACAEALGGEDFGEARVEAMVLYRSDLSPKGAKYTAVATLPFGG
jgi:2'-5' RNA ligase